MVAGLLEIGWSSALKKADGIHRPGWAITGIVLATTSLLLFSVALRDLPVGTAYAVWVGIGTVGVALTGVIVFADRISPIRLFSLAAIIMGVVGLRLVGG